jgi:hypothetical protein
VEIGSHKENASRNKPASTGAPGLAGAAVRQALRHALITAAGRRDQFTGSGPVLERGVLRQFQVDQRNFRAGLVEFRGFGGVIFGRDPSTSARLISASLQLPIPVS